VFVCRRAQQAPPGAPQQAPWGAAPPPPPLMMQAPQQQHAHAQQAQQAQQAPPPGGLLPPPPMMFGAPGQAPPGQQQLGAPMPHHAPHSPQAPHSPHGFHAGPPPPPLGAAPRASVLPASPASPGRSAPAGGAGGGSGSGSRIDPSQIPRPSYAPPAAAVHYDTRVAGASPPPPSASVAFCARDTGNCSPRYMRATTHAVPTTHDLLSTSGLTLALLVQPLALPGPGEADVAVVTPGEGGPVRCARCKAYMNPFVRWRDGGNAWACSLCGGVNDTARDYFCPTAPDGRRADADERPELCRGSVEYEAGEAYMVRPPMAPAYLFLIDASQAAVASGLTASACDAAKRVLGALGGGERARAAVATFDTAPHFYRLRAPGAPPHMLIVADAAAPHAPARGGGNAGGLLVNTSERRGDLEALLDAIPGLFASARAGGAGPPALGAALKAAAECLAQCGGRVLAFASGLPESGWGALAPRPPTADAEAPKACAPADKTYPRLAAEAAEYQVSFDLFLAPSAPGAPCDAASLGVLCSGTGGALYHYPCFTPALDFAQLHNDLAWDVSRPAGLEAVARLRASTGLSVVDYCGAFAKRTPTDVDLPHIDCDKALGVTLRLEERLSDGGEAVLQFAMLYTTAGGARRIRVHTLALPVVGALAALFRAADLDAVLAMGARRAARELLRGGASPSPAALRERATSDAVTVLHAYRRYCASNSSAGQLILPEALKLLPLYTLGLMKSPGLRPDAPPDERVAWALRTLAAPAHAAVPAVYPRLFDVAALPEPPPDGDDDEGGGSGMALPGTAWVSSERLAPEGVVLLENGHDAFVHVGPAAPPGLLAALFGTPGGEGVSSAAPLPRLRTPASRALHALLQAVRRQRGAYLRLRVVRRPDHAAEAAFFRLMIEDRSPDGMSYVELLCHVHRQIQSRFN
jgi:protein transport protein SEC24